MDASPPQEPATKPVRGRRWVRVMLGILAAAIAVRGMLPMAIGRAAEWQARKALGRLVDVADVDLGLLAGRVVLHGVWVGGPVPPEGRRGAPVDPEAAVLGFERLALDLGWLDLLFGRLRVEESAIRRPTVRLDRLADGSLAPLVLAEPEAEPSSEPPEPGSGGEETLPREPPDSEPPGAWPVLLDAFELEEGLVEMRLRDADATRVVDFELEGLTITDLSFRDGAIGLGDVALRRPHARVRRDLLLPGARPVDAAVADEGLGPEAREPEDSALRTRPQGPQESVPQTQREGAQDPQPGAPPEVAEDRRRSPEAASADEGPVGPGAAGVDEPPSGVPGEADAQAPGSGFPTIGIDRLSLERAEFTLATEERTLDVALSLEARRATLREPFDLDARLEVGEKGGFVELEGRARAIPPFYAGALRWSELPLAELVGIADLDLPLTLRTGTAKGELDVRFGEESGSEAEGIAIRGRVQLEGLDLAADLAEVALPSLEVVLADADVPLGPAARQRGADIALARVALRSPHVKARRTVQAEGETAGPGPVQAEGETAGAGPVQAEGETAGAGPGPGDGESPPTATSRPADGASTPRLSLALLEIADGRVEFEDPSVEPGFTAHLREVSVRLQGARWPERSLERIELSSRGPGPAAVRLDGGLEEGDGRLDLRLDGLELPALNGYLRPALGQDVSRGSLGLHTVLSASLPERIEATNELVLHRIGFRAAQDPEFEAQFGVSLPLAMALLSDAGGNVTLEPRVVLERGSVRLGPILREAFTEALQGALRAPLRGLGTLGGLALDTATGRTRGFEPFPMEPGGTRLDSAALARLSEAAAVLAEHPRLGLVLRGRTDERDDPFLAEQILAETVARGKDLPALEDVGVFQRRRIRAALKERARGEAGSLSAEDEAVLRRWIAATSVPDERRVGLARRRAEVIREELVEGHGVARGRLGVGQRLQGSPGVAFDLSVAEPSRESGASPKEDPPDA